MKNSILFAALLALFITSCDCSKPTGETPTKDSVKSTEVDTTFVVIPKVDTTKKDSVK